MRAVILALICSVASGTAYAGSIEKIVPRTQANSSLMSFSCADCPPDKAVVVETREQKMALKPGEQRIEVKDVNGTKHRFSTENWFGGSPVIFVTKEPGQMQLPQTAEQPLPVDPSATSALNQPPAGQPALPEMHPAGVAASLISHGAGDAVPPKLADAPPPPPAAPAPVAEKPLDTDGLQLRVN